MMSLRWTIEKTHAAGTAPIRGPARRERRCRLPAPRPWSPRTPAARYTSPVMQPGADPPLLVKMQLDALDELARVADLMPQGARDGVVPGLNVAGWTLAHLAAQQDRYWNVAAQSLDSDAWLVGWRAADGAAAASPPFTDARDALARVDERCRSYLESVQRPDFDTAVSGGRTLGDLLARSVAHIFAHAGELAAIASLWGAPDMGLPGALPRSNSPRENRNAN